MEKLVWEEFDFRGKLLSEREKSVHLAVSAGGAFFWPKKLFKGVVNTQRVKIVGSNKMSVNIYGSKGVGDTSSIDLTWEEFKAYTHQTTALEDLTNTVPAEVKEVREKVAAPKHIADIAEKFGSEAVKLEKYVEPTEEEWNVMNRLDIDEMVLRSRRKAGLNDDGSIKAETPIPDEALQMSIDRTKERIAEEEARIMKEKMFKDMQKG